MGKLLRRKRAETKDAEAQMMAAFFIAVLLVLVKLTATVLFYFDEHATQERLWRMSKKTLLLGLLSNSKFSSQLSSNIAVNPYTSG